MCKAWHMCCTRGQRDRQTSQIRGTHTHTHTHMYTLVRYICICIGATVPSGVRRVWRPSTAGTCLRRIRRISPPAPAPFPSSAICRTLTIFYLYLFLCTSSIFYLHLSRSFTAFPIIFFNVQQFVFGIFVLVAAISNY